MISKTSLASSTDYKIITLKLIPEVGTFTDENRNS